LAGFRGRAKGNLAPLIVFWLTLASIIELGGDGGFSSLTGREGMDFVGTRGFSSLCRFTIQRIRMTDIVKEKRTDIVKQKRTNVNVNILVSSPIFRGCFDFGL